MRTMPRVLWATFALGGLLSWGADADPHVPPPAAAPVVKASYPLLCAAGLSEARLTPLPEATVFRLKDWTITRQQVADELAKAPDELRPQLTRNAFFVLEQLVIRQLVQREADAASKGHAEAERLAERDRVSWFVARLVADVKVTDDEVAAWYHQNRDQVGNATCDEVKPQVTDFLHQEKQQAVIRGYIAAAGRRWPLEVAADWVKEQAALALDNPVDRARQSGRPSLVDFGSHGCAPCDQLTPILADLKTKYADRANVLFVPVREEQILAARYGIQTIPVQVFFAKDGTEVYRHQGFFPQVEIEQKLAELGVK